MTKKMTKISIMIVLLFSLGICTVLVEFVASAGKRPFQVLVTIMPRQLRATYFNAILETGKQGYLNSVTKKIRLLEYLIKNPKAWDEINIHQIQPLTDWKHYGEPITGLATTAILSSQRTDVIRNFVLKEESSTLSKQALQRRIDFERKRDPRNYDELIRILKSIEN